MTEPQPKRRRGCLFYVVALIVIMIFGGYLGLVTAKKFITQFTETQPAQFPAAQMPEAQLFQLHDRVDTFRNAVRDNETTPPLELSAADLNALIATDPALDSLKGHLYVEAIEDFNQVRAQVSVPADELGFDTMRGRYLNATGIFNVSLANGELVVNAQALSAKGKPYPRYFMRKIAGQNLAHKLNEDPKATAGLNKLQSIELKNNKLVITAKHP